MSARKLNFPFSLEHEVPARNLPFFLLGKRVPTRDLRLFIFARKIGAD